MIYSQWSPDTGGYVYLEAPGTQNINDDLPTPELPPATKIGVPSIETGRPVPSGAQKVGEGDEAVGLIAPVDGSRIVRRTRSLGSYLDTPGMHQAEFFWLAAGAAGAALIWHLFKKKR